MLQPDTIAPLVTDALGRVLVRLGEDPAALPPDLAERVRRYGRVKGERGRAEVARALGLHEAELAAFDPVVRDVERTFARRDGSAPADRNATIAGVRFLSWMETLGQRVPALAPGSDLDALASEDLGRKKVRALELIVRSLITESYADQGRLLARLRQALSEKVVGRWEAAADPGDILSGCTFSELASLFVDKEEFARYERLYEDTPFLTLLRERRRTLQAFLDDVRRVRNRIAHNKAITPTQLTLLDLYYEEIVAPVQTAHDEGRTRVDPSAYLEIGREELDGWFDRLREDVVGVRSDLADLRASLEGRLDEVAAATGEIRSRTRGLDRKVVGIAAGVAVLLLIGLFLAFQGRGTGEDATAARKASERTETTVARTADDARAAREAGEATARRTEAIAAGVEETAASARDTAEAAAGTQAAAEEAAAQAEDAGRAAKEAGDRIEGAAGEVSRSAEAMAHAAGDTQRAAGEMKETGERVAQTLEELRDGFAALVKQGGIIPDATRPQELYHNARILEQRGDIGRAMQSYRAYFAFGDLDFVDPHLRFLAFLKLQNGLAGAREVYYDLKKDAAAPVFAFAWNLLLEGETRVKGLEAFLDAHPDFAPAWYALSRDFSVARLGTQTLEDKRREKDALKRFLALQDEGSALKYYLDQAVAVEQVEDARERLAAVSAVPEAVLENPVSASGMRSNAGWSVTLSIADTVKEILYRVGREGEFRSTGFLPGIRTQAGLPMAKPSIELPPDAARAVIQVKYKDPRDREHGPYEVVFDPEVMLLESTKSALELTRNSWLSFRDYDGKVLLYFTPLLSYRSALSEIRYGLDTDTPDKTFAFSPADPRQPYAVDPDDPLWLTVPETTRYAVVQLTYKDGTRSEVVTIRR